MAYVSENPNGSKLNIYKLEIYIYLYLKLYLHRARVYVCDAHKTSNTECLAADRKSLKAHISLNVIL